ncbi:MAG: SgcJ/EcaC family oxidoreductase [Actinobacteria bacterium]|nr:MAG: SgcJ/EcaC family oxidoreductase [Actinomycetota bacterium]
MRFHRWTSTGLSVLGCALLVFTSLAAAEPKDDVGAATMRWAQTLGQNDPDKVVVLYASDGVLWGTLSPTVRADRAALRDYFVAAFRVLPNLKVTFGQQLIRVYGHTAVNTGYYTFSYSKDGELKTLPARYSFTFVKDGENWMIVDHHSSAMPTPPR